MQWLFLKVDAFCKLGAMQMTIAFEHKASKPPCEHALHWLTFMCQVVNSQPYSSSCMSPMYLPGLKLCLWWWTNDSTWLNCAQQSTPDSHFHTNLFVDPQYEAFVGQVPFRCAVFAIAYLTWRSSRYSVLHALHTDHGEPRTAPAQVLTCFKTIKDLGCCLLLLDLLGSLGFV